MGISSRRLRRRSRKRKPLIRILAIHTLLITTTILVQPTRSQQQEQQQQQKKQVIRYPKWLQTAVKISQQYGHYDAQSNTVIQQKIRNMPTILKLHEIHTYMSSVVHNSDDSFYEPVRDECVLKHEFCAEAAAIQGLCPPDGNSILDLHALGQCPDGASTFMENNCAPACNMCHKLSYATRCGIDREKMKPYNALQESGELHDLFEGMLRNEKLQREYGPVTIHSRPGGRGSGGADSTEVFDGPYIVTYDNFLTPEECAVLRHHGTNTGEGFTRSNTGTGQHVSNSTNIRTSSTNWCRDGCHDDPVVRNVHQRMEELTGIPQENYEYLQILRYDISQVSAVTGEFGKRERTNSICTKNKSFVPRGDFAELNSPPCLLYSSLMYSAK